MSNINVGNPCIMTAIASGVRPSTDPKDKSSLKEGGLFVNLMDNVICIGTGSGGYKVYSLTPVAVVNGNG